MQPAVKELDRNYLLHFYQDMTDELGEIFELFLLETEPTVLKIITLIKKSDLVTAEEELHKIAPSFYSVGLPQLTTKLTVVDKVVKAGNAKKASDLITIFYEDFKTYLPAVEAEMERLQIVKACACN
ncbi:hypothetical protein [Ferruginibacter sp.]